MRSGATMILLGAGVVVVFLSLLGLSQGSSCPLDPGHCSCMPNEASFDIWCPRTENHLFQITLKPRILGISCNFNEDIRFSELLLEFQKLDLGPHGDIDELYYHHCPIPLNQSFSALSSALNLSSSIKELYLSYNTLDEGGFREGQFKGLSSDLERIKINTPKFKNGGQFNPLSSQMFDGVRSQLKSLLISTNAVDTIPDGLLKSMTSLEILDINEKVLQELYESTFSDLNSLERLYLSSKTLKALPLGLLKNNTALKYVEFGISNLTSSIPTTLFQGLEELKTLDVKGNFLQMCPPEMFITNNKLDKITWNIFFPCKGCKRGHRVEVPSFAKGASSLKELLIKWNRRYDLIIGNDFLEGCSNLEKFSISKTGLTQLPAQGFFRDTRKLKSINLRSNEISSLPDSFFKGLTLLEDLDLSHNSLQRISTQIFSDQRSLKSLDLSSNTIELIEKYAFHFLSQLEKLNLKRNVLTFDTSSGPKLESLSQLKSIDLSYNKILSPDFNIQLRLVLLSLEDMNLSNNLIGPKLGRDFLRFHQNNLTLNLRNNKIKEIDPFPMHRNQNIVVYLSGNPIDCNCRSLEFHQWIQRPLAERTVAFPDIRRLKCASPIALEKEIFQSVAGGQLSCLFPSNHFPNETCPCRECKFIPYTKTILLNCSSSRLSRTPRSIPSPIKGSHWISLDISNNTLRGPLQIPGNKEYTHNLTELYASFNELTSLPGSLPPNLRLLHLDHNQMELSNEDVYTLVNSASIEDLALGHNLFPCNCKSKALFRLLKAGDKPDLRIQDSTDIYLRNCSINGGVTDIPISQFGDDEEFCLEMNALVMMYALPAIIVLLLLLAFAIVSLIYKEKIIVILYQYPVFRQYFIRNDESKNPYDVFISYSHEDQEYVEGRLVGGLESPEDDPLLKYKCLLAVRDFVPGEVISEQIVRAVDSSSRTIIVLSEGFLRSEWAKYEFEIAHSRRKVILLKVGDLPEDSEVIDPALMNYISQNTYLEIDHPNFWRNLRYALPHKGNSKYWRPSWLQPRKTVEQLSLMESTKTKKTVVPPQNQISNSSLPV